MNKLGMFVGLIAGLIGSSPFWLIPPIWLYPTFTLGGIAAVLILFGVMFGGILFHDDVWR